MAVNVLTTPPPHTDVSTGHCPNPDAIGYRLQ